MTLVEMKRNIDEEQETDDLEPQPSQHDFPSGTLQACRGGDLHSCTTKKGEEADYIDNDESGS